jgi:hypothetical protein
MAARSEPPQGGAGETETEATPTSSLDKQVRN